MDAPIVYGYNNFRKYLADWFVWTKSRDRKLTKSAVSRRLGLPNTRSFFNDVLAGKLVTELFLDRFVEVLALPPEEARFFRTLARFNQAASPEEREIAFDQLVALNRTPQRVLDPREYRYYRHWWNGALRALLAVENFGDDWTALARRLVPRTTAKQAREAVELMESLGLVAKGADGFWKPREGTLSTGEGSRDELVLQLQMQQLDLARRAVLAKFDQPKEIATNTLHLSDGALDKIRQRLARFRSEVRAIAHKDDQPPTRVYNLCLALYPLTTKVRP